MSSKQNDTSKIIKNPLNHYSQGLSRTGVFSTSLHSMRKMRVNRYSRQLKSLLNSMPDFNICEAEASNHNDKVDHYLGVVGELINSLYKLHNEMPQAGAHCDNGTDK